MGRVEAASRTVTFKLSYWSPRGHEEVGWDKGPPHDLGRSPQQSDFVLTVSLGPRDGANQKMTAVGFEPTQLELVELESTPLDHSGKLSLRHCKWQLLVSSLVGLGGPGPTGLLNSSCGGAPAGLGWMGLVENAG